MALGEGLRRWAEVGAPPPPYKESKKVIGNDSVFELSEIVRLQKHILICCHLIYVNMHIWATFILLSSSRLYIHSYQCFHHVFICVYLS